MDISLNRFERILVALLVGAATAPVCAGPWSPALELAFPAGYGWDEPLAAEPLLAQPADYAAENAAPAQDAGPRIDEYVQPTQFGIGTALSLQVGLDAQTRLQAGQPQRGTGAAIAGLASIPFMIGDTGAGTCVSFNTIGYIEGDLAHPTLTCGRLNVSENNTPLTADRVYYSYRHFENSTPVRLFQFKEIRNIDRHTLGGEKTFRDGLWSIEARIPIEQRLSSNPYTRVYDFDPADGIIDPETFQLSGRSEVELANVSLILKRMLLERENCAISGGLGITLPTAKDVLYTIDIFNASVDYTFLTPPFVVYTRDYFIETEFKNETVYLAPFLAWAHRPRERFFHHGFLQVEVAANPSEVTVRDYGSFGFVAPDYVSPIDYGVIWTIDGVYGGQATVPLHAQTLLRLNLGCGYFLVDEPRNSLLKQLVAMAELHYTTPLQRAKLSRIPLEAVLFSGTETVDIDAFDPTIGNLNSRIDIINATLGMSAKIRKTTITNGFTVPLRGQDNRGFDFEYNLQVQREF